MADQLAVDVKCRVGWLYRDLSGLATIADASHLEYARTFVDGVASEEADKIWHHGGMIAGGESHDWELSALRRQLFGSEIQATIARVKLILLVNLGTASSDVLELKSSPVRGWSAAIGEAGVLQAAADSCLLLTNRRTGWGVSAGTADRVRIFNPGLTAIEYQLVVVGCSA